MKVKVSATVDPDRLAEAKEVTGCANVSEIIDRALTVLIEHELERVHEQGYSDQPQAGDTVDRVDPAIWSDLPWDDD